MASESKEQELIPADEKPRWTVSSSEPDSDGKQVHRLFWGGVKQARGTTPADLRRFRELADFCNKRGLVPRPKVLCKADESLPVPKHKAVTDDTYTSAAP
jgi:hypothetical protein